MKSALIIGASRGIGRQIAVTLAQNNFGVVVASKSVESTDKLPGSINTVAQEITSAGGVAYPIRCDCRNEADIHSAVQHALTKFHGLDVAVYNAGAILWKPVLETPLKRFDLMMAVNVRGAYAMVQEVLPHFLSKKSGKIVLVAPPIYNRFFKGKTAYSISKVGMTVLAKGLANELTGTDAVLGIVNEPTEKLNGACLLDEDYLRTEGVTDFSKYRCDPDHEPRRMMPKILPNLTVEEENEQFKLDSKL